MSVLEQGDVIRINFTPAVGHEPAMSHPSVVASVFEFNVRSSLVMVIPITRIDTGYPLHVRVDGAGVRGYACVEQMPLLDVQQRGYEILGPVDDVTLREIVTRLRSVFALK